MHIQEASLSDETDGSGRFHAGERLICTAGKYKGSVVRFVRQLPMMVQVKFDSGEVRRVAPYNVAIYDPENSLRISVKMLSAMVKERCIQEWGLAVKRKAFLRICKQVARDVFEE